MPAPTDPSHSLSPDVDIDVPGTIPRGLAGRMVGIGRDGFVHSVQIRADQTVSYRSRRCQTDAIVDHIVEFGDSLLAFGDDTLAYELSAELDTLHPVDLAGRGRSLAPFPKQDPTTGELHLVAHAADGTQAHVVVSAGAFTRSNRPILDAPNRVTDLVLTGDRVVFVADGSVGITSRDDQARTTWIVTGDLAPQPVHAHDAGDTVVLFALTPSLERWTVHPGAGSVQREVLDPTPRRFAHPAGDGADGAPRVLWTTGDETIRRHDLVDSRRVHKNLGPFVPGDFVVASDTQRPGGTGEGWLVGLVHDLLGTTTDLCVFDAADLARPAVATVRVPRPIPQGIRCTWIPSTHH
jgi:carotenoid cleavage dioxygenase-like enzyme